MNGDDKGCEGTLFSFHYSSLYSCRNDSPGLTVSIRKPSNDVNKLSMFACYISLCPGLAGVEAVFARVCILT